MNSAAKNLDAGTLQEQVKHMSTEGFVLQERLCDRRLLNTLLDISRRRILTVREALGPREIGIGSAAGFMELVQRSLGRWDVPIEPEKFGVEERKLPWWPLVAAVLGEDAEHSFSGVVSSEPGSPAQFWHIDSPHEAPEHREAHAINVLVALHDIPLEMGPTECARGSHYLTNHLTNPCLLPEHLIYQHDGTTPEVIVRGTGYPVPEGFSKPMAAGSCLAFDDRILHRGLANHSDDTRYVAYFSYRKKGYFSEAHFESVQSVFEAIA